VVHSRRVSTTSSIVRFGAFEVDLATGELRKHGLRIRLQVQPFQVLTSLLQRPGEVVCREELIRRIWPDGTVVDFDRGLNAAVTRLRQTLSDSAETPRYIETVSRRGYRFIGSLHVDHLEPPATALAAAPSAGLVTFSSPRIMWLVVALLVSGALLLWRLNRQPTRQPRQFTKPIPLTLGEGVERNPSFSPDGSQIVYQWEQEGHSHIYVKGLGAGDPISLSSGDGAEYSPSWSPDGNSIAYIGRQQSSWGIFVVAPVGGTPRKITDFPGPSFATSIRPYRYLDWTSDNRHVIVSSMGGSAVWEALMLVSLETGEKTWLTRPAAQDMSGDREPAVSPDGRTVAFARGGLGFEHLYLLPLTADLRPEGPPRALPTAAPARSPVWVPDGSALIFAGPDQNIAAGLELYWMDLTSKAPPRNLTAFGTGLGTPAVSRNGSLAYSTLGRESTLWRQDIPIPNQPVPAPIKVKSAATVLIIPAYSPDGSHLALASERSGTREIWNCASDGSHCLQITSTGSQRVNDVPRWSPDGKQIVFQSMAGAVVDAYVVNSTGGPTRRVTSNDHHGFFPYWSHNGKWIYYSLLANKQHVIWKIPADGGTPSQVSRGRVLVDGEDSSVLYYADDSKIFRSASDGSGKTALLNDVWLWSFAVGGDRIYYLHSESERVNEIRQFQLSTRMKSTVRRIDKPLVYGLTLSPDGKSLIYSEVRSRGNVMIAESHN